MNFDATIAFVDDLHTMAQEYGYQRNLLVEICQTSAASRRATARRSPSQTT